MAGLMRGVVRSSKFLLSTTRCSDGRASCFSWRNACRGFSGGTVSDERIGFIGLGNMGSHMATNLLKAGHSLIVYDRNEAALNALGARGALLAISPREVAEGSDVVITMLPASAHVEEVFTGHRGLLSDGETIRPSLLIDCSTIDPQTSRLLAATVARHKLADNSRDIGTKGLPVMLDSPVSGGVIGAQAGTLTFMVGGPKEGLKAAEPLLLAMGKKIVYCGGSGNGAGAKLCNNLAMAISMAGVSEALALGQRLGIDATTLSQIFNSSSARCWSSDTYNPVPGVMESVPSSRNYQGGFSCQLLTKDLSLALLAAAETGTTVPLGSEVYDMFRDLCNEGHGYEDFSSIFCHKYKGHAEFSTEIVDSASSVDQSPILTGS